MEREYSNWYDNDFNPKHHTIRAGNRFKVGEKFSPRVWSGTPYRSKQIIISEDVEVKQIFSFELKKSDYILSGKKLSLNDLEVVAKNDGLSCDDFECWFNSKPFKGQVICWSDEVRYDKPGNIDNVALAEVPWMGHFRTSEYSHILSKTALIKGDKIGAYNPLGQLIWVERNQNVILCP